MKNFSDEQKDLPDTAERDMERIRKEFGKGMEIEEIADKLNMDRDYAEFLFWFGIV